MLKYVDARVVFQEIPDEITLAINISNCPCHCKGCHSQYLAEDIGKPLIEYPQGFSDDYIIHLDELITDGISCIAFMGGDSDPHLVNVLASFVKDYFWCDYNPIWVVWNLFRDTSKIELLNDFDIFRDEDTDEPAIIMDRLNDFLLTIGKPTVEKVNGYKNI
jgi:anaerobic ribonucleoside-triphosphate reductase activating protein